MFLSRWRFGTLSEWGSCRIKFLVPLNCVYHLTSFTEVKWHFTDLWNSIAFHTKNITHCYNVALLIIIVMSSQCTLGVAFLVRNYSKTLAFNMSRRMQFDKTKSWLMSVALPTSSSHWAFWLLICLQMEDTLLLKWSCSHLSRSL
jgi:hypothetical protein